MTRRQFTVRTGTVAAAAAAPAAPTAPRSTADWKTCLAVARALLVVGEDNKPLVPEYEKILLGDGLPKAGAARKKVTGRHGRRFAAQTSRSPRHGRRGQRKPRGRPHQDVPHGRPRERRIPGSHPLVIGLIDHLGIERRPFHYIDVDPDGKPVYRTWIRVNGIRARRADYAKNPRAINRSFGVPRTYLDVPASEIVRQALDPVRDEYSARRPDGSRVNKPMPELVDLIGTLENMTSRLPLSFMHSFTGASLISPGTRFYELTGGTAVLADALLDDVRDEVRFDRRVTRIETREEGAPGPRVVLHTVSEGRDGKVVRERFSGDTAIVTVPFSGLRHVQVSPQLSYGKRRAVCEVHYDSATKVLLEFSRRWWEMSEADWKRELNAMESGLYDAYRKGRVPAAGSPVASRRRRRSSAAGR